MKKTKKFHISVGLAVLFLIAFTSLFAMPGVFATSYKTVVDVAENVVEEVTPQVIKKEVAEHVPIPDEVKTIYMSSCVAGTPSFRDDLVEIVRETEINSIIIDIKDFTGTISFPPTRELLRSAWEAAPCGTSGMKDFVASLHSEGIYVIGRITVFQDPLYTKAHPEQAVQKASDRSTWKDYKGLAFVDVGAKEYWDYIVELSHESYELGFDELNYDYVRFPSDGPMNNIYYPISEHRIVADPDNGKVEVLRDFFEYLDKELRPDPSVDIKKRLVTSADLFGMTTTNNDDLNIGQKLEYALPYFDFIAPMVYPSHYPKNFNGYGNPNHYPHEVVEFAMTGGVEKVTSLLSSSTTPQSIKDRVHKLQLRPWLQDFDYGGDYGPEEVRTQIEATYDSGLTSWMLWAPSNRYTKEALLR